VIQYWNWKLIFQYRIGTSPKLNIVWILTWKIKLGDCYRHCRILKFVHKQIWYPTVLESWNYTVFYIFYTGKFLEKSWNFRTCLEFIILYKKIRAWKKKKIRRKIVFGYKSSFNLARSEHELDRICLDTLISLKLLLIFN